MKPESFRDQISVIDRLTEYVNRSFGLVVIDTLTSLYRLQLSESPTKAFDLNRELNRQTALLVQVARAEKVAVMMTSQVTSVFNDANVSVEPVATRVLKFWADIILVMKPTERPGIIRAVMEKNPRGTRTSSFDLRINDSGIHDYHEHR
jgi:RecA/RadA recombinase